jgi:hypothetical protein
VQPPAATAAAVAALAQSTDSNSVQQQHISSSIQSDHDEQQQLQSLQCDTSHTEADGGHTDGQPASWTAGAVSVSPHFAPPPVLPEGRRALLQLQQELPQQVLQAHQQQQQAVRSKLSVELARKSDAAAATTAGADASADGGADTDDTVEGEHTEQVSGCVYSLQYRKYISMLQQLLSVAVW